MVMVSTGTKLLDVLFCCLQIRWSEKKIDEVSGSFLSMVQNSTNHWYVIFFQHRFESWKPLFSQKQNLEVNCFPTIDP